MSKVPDVRIRPCNDRPHRADGLWVVYWMIAQRRVRYNFALQRAVEWASRLGRPLLVLEALSCDYPWASDRFHRFVVEGLADNARALRNAEVRYYPYVEPKRGAGSGLLEFLCSRAAVVVTDEYPCFFLPRVVDTVAARSRVLVEAVDSYGLLPLAATDRAFPRAHSFRRFLQRQLPEHLGALPKANPLARVRLPPRPQLPRDLIARWPAASAELLAASPEALAKLPLDHGVRPTHQHGGATAAGKALKTFLDGRLDDYVEHRNRPESNATSDLSAYLHSGHLASSEVFAALVRREGWSAQRLGSTTRGAREGWWGMSPAAEAFLDQLVTWRELGANMCFHRDDYDQYESLPDWARKTLARHERDVRPYVYSLDEFESAATHDEIWNAAQRQLFLEGRIHNYLRMLWGKKILHWSASPREALAIMIELNNKYALDGRDPNSYSGIFWILGRYDRAWGPERKIFGTIRYMSSKNTARKLSLQAYLERFGRDHAGPVGQWTASLTRRPRTIPGDRR